MAERKCGVCRQTGHTRATCPGQVADVTAAMAQLRETDKEELLVADPGPMPFPQPDPTKEVIRVMGERAAVAAAEADAPFTEPRPIYTGSKPGPWFSAAFPGICEAGGEGFEQGEEIRADGQGGYECRDCVSDAENPPDVHTASLATWERPTAANVKLPPTEPIPATVDAFDTPAPVAAVHARGAGKTDRYGHRLKDPILGDFRRFKNGNIQSVTRVTTFNKAVESTDGLTGWMKRNVLLGAAARPDVVAQAHGKNHDDHKAMLNALVAQLEKEAGSGKAADAGTYIHKLTEEFDAGRVTMDDIPPAYRQMITLYRDALAAAGLQVVPQLLEATTFVGDWGGVSGSFDKVYEHVATGSHYIGDVKTGKTMDFGWAPIECQEAIYAKGYNRHGTYDWNTETWQAPTLRVSEAVGIVVHLPVKGEHVGTCRVLAADLERGWDYAGLCGAVRTARKVKAAPVLWGEHVASLAPAAPVRDWDAEFSGVVDVAAAGTLWEEARAAGVAPMELQRLVSLAQSALRSMSQVDKP